jgi:hypothetical protein
MKLLPKKTDIDKAKADERKREIDEGITLARKVDTLRELKSNEERNLLEYRATALKEIQKEIDSRIEIRNSLDDEIVKKQEIRKQLIKPLDEEWKEIKEAKDGIKEEKESIFISREQLKQDQHKLEEDRTKLSDLIIKAKDNEGKTEKLKSEVISLKDIAQKEYEKAKSEHDSQTETHQIEMSKVLQLQKEYENGILINKLDKKKLEEKESDLIIREKDLIRQQNILKIAKGVIK